MNEETIFAAAREKKTPAERQAYLDEACAGNVGVRAAVDELLRADADAGSFLDHPPAGMEATVISGSSSKDTVNAGHWAAALPFLKPCDKPGRIGLLDQYEIIEVVGHGGMGAVLRAFDTKLSRVVAVKVMSPTLAASATSVKRFLREATTAASVHHDHVVTIHAVDDSHAPPYLVMQFVEGQTLQEKIDREGALALAQILRIGSQAAAGLAAAHKLGLIHRDVKPANILLENGVERVKITDFGLARAADDVQMTQTGIIAGTPQYMSPEQARGEPVDARSDLFSLGSVLYTMCTGRPAFRADNPVAVLRRVCDDMPRPIHEVNAEIPLWLEAIVEKLLAKNPADRFQSAAEVAELLSQHLAHVQNPALTPFPAPLSKVLSHAQEKTHAAEWWPAAPLWLAASLFAAIFLLVNSLRLIRSAYDAHSNFTLFLGLNYLFTAAILFWIAITQMRRMARLRGQKGALPASKPTTRGLMIEHPVLGWLIMLIVSASVATYMLTSAGHRSSQRAAATAKTTATDGTITLPALPDPNMPPGQSIYDLNIPGLTSVSLFNGKDLTGWETLPGQPGTWKVEGGAIIGRGGISHLFSEKTYGNFHLRVEACLLRGDSGVFFRSELGLPKVSKITGLRYPDGYEAEIADPKADKLPGNIGSIRPLAPVLADLVPMGEWFTLEVIADDNHLISKINGQTTVDIVDPKRSFASGHLVLGCGGAGLPTTVQFRKIEIKELPNAVSP
jgi:serine/threonine protein kinase